MKVYSRTALIASCPSPLGPETVFFWGHRPKAGGRMGPFCLSQWYESLFTIDGVAYPTAEHFMMAEKARLFGDKEALEQILTAPEPSLVKAIGRHVQGFEEARWDAAADEIVFRGNLAKFQSSEPLRIYLLGTREAVLVEASPQDVVWGIGLSVHDLAARDPRRWRGENRLGFALMRVRDCLVEASRHALA